MYPILFTIPYLDLPVTTFGVMMAAGFLTAYWLTALRFEEEGVDVELAPNFLIWIVIGGVLGSKLYYTIDQWALYGTPMAQSFFARAGITWYGGLIGGMLAGSLCSRFYGVPILTTLNCGAVGCAVGQSLGRVGCFLVGDDYGVASDLPWAVAFPLGAPPVDYPVHPTQLYEVAWLLPIAALLWSRRKKSPFLFGEYLFANGLGRLVIENWRLNDEVALGLTEPQWIGIALMAIGATAWIVLRSRGAAGDASS